MNTKTIDLVNIVLMIISCVFAFVIPFELFLFSYAVLGPLHYLTEIGWLRKRDYFLAGKNDYMTLVILCIAFSGISVIAFTQSTPVISYLHRACVWLLGGNFVSIAYMLLYMGFASALAFVVFKDTYEKVRFIAIALIIGLLIQNTKPFLLIFAMFLPTLIHTFLFTAFFILLGALKNKSFTGYLSILVFIGCSVSFFVLFPHFTFYRASEYAQNALVSSGFSRLNTAFMELFRAGTITQQSIFASNFGVATMRFIAFGYTYHYLNWFSKTSVIKWHQVPNRWLAAIIIIWVFSVVVYIYDYRTGLIMAYLLSMLHVFLEFPLNYRSVIGISQEIKNYFSRGKAALVPEK